MASEYDLTPRMAPNLDRHLVFPLLEFLQERQIYNDNHILKAKIDLLNNTNMVDYAMDIHKTLYQTEGVPQDMVERRADVVARLKSLEDAAAPLVAFLQNAGAVQELKADKHYNLQMLNDKYQFGHTAGINSTNIFRALHLIEIPISLSHLLGKGHMAPYSNNVWNRPPMTLRHAPPLLPSPSTFVANTLHSSFASWFPDSGHVGSDDLYEFPPISLSPIAKSSPLPTSLPVKAFHLLLQALPLLQSLPLSQFLGLNILLLSSSPVPPSSSLNVSNLSNSLESATPSSSSDTSQTDQSISR
ncbi:Eukaryotic translation initiation factor 3 subunit E, variant 2 [Lathyrus oleraceus]|uniref:Eukaryotic translation initiation factor 3 subunit E, variant 2 n=1 Tax=Pisum sativum TaxID=3888 RepID=A0A9D4X1R8_PEA|nr:Eukaryotic translation initiation factor 3 subunit E, variant 2 [Pisum sativum]